MNLNEDLTSGNYQKGPVILDKKANTASMEVTYKGHRISVKVGYNTSNFSEPQAVIDLEATLSKMLALENYVKILHPGMETRQLFLEKTKNILVYEPQLTEEQSKSDVPPMFIVSSDTIEKNFQEETQKLKSKGLESIALAQAKQRYTAIVKVKELFAQNQGEKYRRYGKQLLRSLRLNT